MEISPPHSCHGNYLVIDNNQCICAECWFHVKYTSGTGDSLSFATRKSNFPLNDTS